MHGSFHTPDMQCMCNSNTYLHYSLDASKTKPAIPDSAQQKELLNVISI